MKVNHKHDNQHSKGSGSGDGPPVTAAALHDQQVGNNLYNVEQQLLTDLGLNVRKSASTHGPSFTDVEESYAGRSSSVSDFVSQHEDASGKSSHQIRQAAEMGVSALQLERMSIAPEQHMTGDVSVHIPLLHVTPTGTIAIMLRNEVIVELAVDKSIRVLCPGKFAAASNARGTSSCIMHPQARIFQEDTRVYAQLGDEKLAVFGSQGVLFTMKKLNQAYLVSSSTIRGTTAIPLSCLQFPALDADFSLSLFYLQGKSGKQLVSTCKGIVNTAHYDHREDGSLTVNIYGIFIKQDVHGQCEVISRPRFIKVNPLENTVSVRTHFVDMGVQENGKSYVKRGVKRLHVSTSGMVVSDGNCITSMDHFGRIVSST